MQTRGDMPPYVTVYVSVESLQETLENVAELGGRVLVQPTPIPSIGSFALFQDIEDNVWAS
jgi:uncharacterized protein